MSDSCPCSIGSKAQIPSTSPEFVRRLAALRQILCADDSAIGEKVSDEFREPCGEGYFRDRETGECLPRPPAVPTAKGIAAPDLADVLEGAASRGIVMNYEERVRALESLRAETEMQAARTALRQFNQEFAKRRNAKTLGEILREGMRR